MIKSRIKQYIVRGSLIATLGLAPTGMVINYYNSDSAKIYYMVREINPEGGLKVETEDKKYEYIGIDYYDDRKTLQINVEEKGKAVTFYNDNYDIFISSFSKVPRRISIDHEKIYLDEFTPETRNKIEKTYHAAIKEGLEKMRPILKEHRKEMREKESALDKKKKERMQYLEETLKQF